MKNRNILRRVCVGAVILCTALSRGRLRHEARRRPPPRQRADRRPHHRAPTPTPEPLPELDIGSWEFTVANSYNSPRERTRLGLLLPTLVSSSLNSVVSSPRCFSLLTNADK